MWHYEERVRVDGHNEDMLPQIEDKEGEEMGVQAY